MKTVYYEITCKESEHLKWIIFDFSNIEKFLTAMFMHPHTDARTMSNLNIERKICRDENELILLREKDAKL